MTDDSYTFSDLGLCQPMVDACKSLGWKYPMPIQIKTIHPAIEKKDICGTAETGSGKTGAYMLPIFHHMWENPHSFFALVFAPTRELATQIDHVTRDIGKDIKVRVCTIIGGVDEDSQVKALKAQPHVVVATPGRLARLIRNNPKVIPLNKVECLVFDEADNMLREPSFQTDIQLILSKLNSTHQTYLFSATMPEEIEQLAKQTMSDPVRLSLTSVNTVARTLTEHLVISETGKKEATLVALMNQYPDKQTIIFVGSCKTATIISTLLSNLNFRTIVYHGQLPQRERINAIDRFKNGDYRVLVATNVGSRGLDVPHVDLVINYELPEEHEEYIHRVGRAGRAERSGVAVTIITANEVVGYIRLENFLKKKIPKKDIPLEKIEEVTEKVELAKRVAVEKYKEMKKKQAQKKKEKARRE